MLKGIDVSNWQGTSFNWDAQADAGIQFAFIKATEGAGFADPDFPRNWAVSRERGLVRGAYHFLHPDQPIEAQAAWFLQHVHAQGLRPGDLLAVDYEVNGGLDPAAAAAAAEHFVDIINSAEPVSCVVYTTQGFALGGYCDGLSASPLWLAAPGMPTAPPPPPWKLISFLQTGQRGVDTDLGNFETTAQLRKLGLRDIDPGPVPTAAAASASSPAASPAPGSAPVTPGLALTGHLHLHLADRLLNEARVLMPDGKHALDPTKLWEAAIHALIGIGLHIGEHL